MASDIIPIIALFGTLFIGLPTIRLLYIEPQLDKLTETSNERKKSADDALEEELRKTRPEKEKVLSFANEIAAQNRRERNIKESSSGNRLQVLLDITAFVSIALLGVAIYENVLLNYLQLFGTLAFLFGMFSVVTFISHYLYVHNLKNKFSSDKKN